MSQSSKVTRNFGSIFARSIELAPSIAVDPYRTPAPVTLADAAAVLSLTQIFSGLAVITPTAARTLTFPTATVLTAGRLDSDTWQITIVNTSSSFAVTVAADASGSLIGSGVIAVSTSATFMIRVSLSGSPTYTIYRK